MTIDDLSSAYTWVAAAVSSKTPAPIADKIVGWFSQILNQTETRELYARNGLEFAPPGPAYLRKFQVEQMAREKRIVAAAGIEMN